VTVWPDTLWLVRHGESAGNIARDAALSAGLHEIDVHVRDVDVPLSPLGERQAVALGRWFGAMPPAEQPTVILASPYVRAMRTAEIMSEAAGLHRAAIPMVFDERLREKEFGILDRLTRAGIEARFPDQGAMRRLLGKFYHRPPGGESWCDVILRLRTVVEMMTREYGRQRVLIVCHSVVVMCFRYILEHMTEAEIMAIDRQTEIANCSVTTYHSDPGRHGRLALSTFNFVAPLEVEGTQVTAEPDADAAIR
jgi:probable phosphoglycerate mutase